MAEIRNKDETSKPSNHSGREQKRSYKHTVAIACLKKSKTR